MSRKPLVRRVFVRIPKFLLIPLALIALGLASAQQKASTPVGAGNEPEMASRDVSATFKANVKLVLVRAVVRDAKGNAIGNLQKENFLVFDKGKPQVVTF